MKTKKHKSKNNIVFGAVVGLAGIACGLWLLISLEKLSGTEFVAFSLGFAVVGLIIAFAAEVQEFSIAGNGVKLKELRSEAERTIEDLKRARTEVFRFMVQKSIEFSGVLGSGSKVDERVEQFIKLFEQIEKFDCIKELQIDISKALNILMVGQFNNLAFIHNNTKSVGDIFGSKEKPDLLYIELKDEMINQIIERIQPKQEFEYVKEDVIEGIKAYAKLYAIKVKLDKLEKEL
ncbi:hypothetical protein E0H80_06945 [Acinetobacter sp. ANC 4779]|uniref:hypothetical protein n=1 Tax=Acinetobacter sp. ANC 4779 TaxID=2529848 RepID=UPI00103DC55F|nr:hypothetical protein [Acinetobacter sp. ANC 4779]TCB51097.1 hypothetical protein E0H80_06945 [Acinetobacter sp. ANC 4779]